MNRRVMGDFDNTGAAERFHNLVGAFRRGAEINMGLQKGCHYASGILPIRKSLFFRLLKKAERQEFDDSFLGLAVEYKKLDPDSERFDVFYGWYAAYHGAYSVALEAAKKAEEKRPLNLEVWKLISQCYHALKRPMEAIPYDAMCEHFYEVPLDITVDRGQLDEVLAIASQSMNMGIYVPFIITKLVYDGGEIERREGSYIGRFIAGTREDWAEPYWVGTYLEQDALNDKGWLLEQQRDEPEFIKRAGVDSIFDIMRSREIEKEIRFQADAAYILPIAGMEAKQTLSFASEHWKSDVYLGKWVYSFFRVEQDVHISSEKPFILGKPIRLGHSPDRKKLILNLWMDGLCWSRMKELKYRDVPHLVDFFSKGIIFNQHFSIGEYTYASIPTIETGMYPRHSNVFNPLIGRRLDKRYKTISEKIRELGYYCASLMSVDTGIYPGTMRGYDRWIVNAYECYAYVGVERCIRQIEAFGECDQMLVMQAMDTHPWAAGDHAVPITTQTLLPLQGRLDGACTEKPSVYISRTPLYERANLDSIRNMDRSLGVLFDYLQSHYGEDEYIVNLYSDHGVPVYDENPHLMSEHQVGAALMVRGAGIPQLGFVEELTSAVDIYPILAKEAGFEVGAWVDGNLPAALGGKEREYVVSESVYPGQTAKICVRTKTHECHLESIEPTDEDGSVDLTGAKMQLFTRKDHREVRDDSLMRYFTGILREYTRPFDQAGCQWPSMRAARPAWYGGKRA